MWSTLASCHSQPTLLKSASDPTTRPECCNASIVRLHECACQAVTPRCGTVARQKFVPRPLTTTRARLYACGFSQPMPIGHRRGTRRRAGLTGILLISVGPKPSVSIKEDPPLETDCWICFNTCGYSIHLGSVGTLPVTVSPVAGLPWHRRDSCPPSAQGPERHYCCLRARRRPSGIQMPLWTGPGVSHHLPKGGPMGLVRADVRGSADRCPESLIVSPRRQGRGPGSLGRPTATVSRGA